MRDRGDVVVVAGTTAGAGDGGVIREAAPEDVRGFDVRTGELLWTFHVVPRAGEFGADTWGDGSGDYSGDLGSWCCLTADATLGHVYIPLSAPTGMVYGGHRPGDNLFSDSLVAVDAKTGERVWHFQMVHHDVWEYDTVGPPTLGDITVEGRRIKAVMQPSKTAFLYVFDPETGLYYAVSHTMPTVWRVVPTTDDPDATLAWATPRGENQRVPTPRPHGLPITKPPYGRITALDLNRGEIAWMAPNGDGPRNHPLLRDLDLPPLGIPNRPAPLVTKTLLFLGEGSDAIIGTLRGEGATSDPEQDRSWRWGKRFRAYNKATGEVIWETELPAGTTGGPMTYRTRVAGTSSSPWGPVTRSPSGSRWRCRNRNRNRRGPDR